MTAPGGLHRPVMADKVVEALVLAESGRYVDATFGRGGHTRAILDHLGPGGRVLAIDKDPAAVAFGRGQLGEDRRVCFERGSFGDLETLVQRHHWVGRVEGVVFDLGVSSPQIDDAQRGFSFSKDGPLDMRMDPESYPSAAQWLAAAPQAEIARVLREFGEERYARRIAAAIIRERAQAPITTTLRLAELIARSVPTREPGQHPATRSFQAIRIVINSELDDLQRGLAGALRVLAPHGRLVVISFHSLEDRIVKRFMRAQSRGDDFPADVPVTADRLRPTLRLVGRAIRPAPQEVALNPRSRSAVLRVAERLS